MGSSARKVSEVGSFMFCGNAARIRLPSTRCMMIIVTGGNGGGGSTYFQALVVEANISSSSSGGRGGARTIANRITTIQQLVASGRR